MSFDKSKISTEKKLDNFTKYVRRQTLSRFVVQYEIFKRQLKIKGSIVECGVHIGGGVMAWAKLSSILEPYNYHRKIIGFDTFEGFPGVSKIDKNRPEVKKGMFKESNDMLSEINASIKEYDENRFINHINKVELIKGDAIQTIPKFITNNEHILISLLYLDFDIYKPTSVALENFIPRMPKGSIIAFDELNNSDWPGETHALLEKFNLKDYKLECFEFEPNISFIQL
jgi:hypothetical protein